MRVVNLFVRLEGLWLAQAMSTAAEHAAPIACEGRETAETNTFVEDAMHVANLSFSRASHTRNALVVQATSNLLAGFLSEGFRAALEEYLGVGEGTAEEGEWRGV